MLKRVLLQLFDNLAVRIDRRNRAFDIRRLKFSLVFQLVEAFKPGFRVDYADPFALLK